MYSIEMIKKMNGEFPEVNQDVIQDIMLKIDFPKSSLMGIIRDLKVKADKYDAYIRDLRAEPLRKNQ